MGCNFCSTSALFGGKGKFVNFFETGDELFAVMCEIEAKLKVRSFFTLDENFLHHKKRALRLLELMEANNKSWALYVFSSARVLQSYTIDQLVRLGIGWVWMGLEGKESAYDKLRGVDTRALVEQPAVPRNPHPGLLDHRPRRPPAGEHRCRHRLCREPRRPFFISSCSIRPSREPPCMKSTAGRARSFRKRNSPPPTPTASTASTTAIRTSGTERKEEYLLDAFRRDFRVNGPSLLRMIRVLLNGWQMYQDDPRERIRKRIAWEVFPLRSTYAGAVWAMRKWFRNDPPLREKAERLLADINAAFGWKTRLVAPLDRPLCLFFPEEGRRTAGRGLDLRTAVPSAKRTPRRWRSKNCPLTGHDSGAGALPAMGEEPVASFGK